MIGALHVGRAPSSPQDSLGMVNCKFMTLVCGSLILQACLTSEVPFSSVQLGEVFQSRIPGLLVSSIITTKAIEHSSITVSMFAIEHNKNYFKLQFFFSNKPAMPDNVLSFTQLRSLPLQDQIRALMTSGKTLCLCVQLFSYDLCHETTRECLYQGLHVKW